MDALFLKLVNMSIAASWVVIVVILLRLLLKKAPKWLHCGLWILVAVRLVCPIAPESVFSLIPSTEALPENVISGNTFDINTGIELIDVPVNDYLGDHYFEGVTVPAKNGSSIMTLLAGIWLIGCAVMVAYAAMSYFRLRRRVSACVTVSKGVRICDYIETPFILGMLKPVIYLPSGMSPDSAQYVLAHERAHLKRRDHLWKPVGFLLLAIHWFNPLIWLGYILLCRDIELACDEKVIQEMNGEDKRAYSEALLQCSVPRRMIAACPLAFGEVGVKERVKSVLNYKKPGFWLILIAVLLCIAVAVCFLTNPVGITLGKLWELTDGEYDSVTVLAGEDSVVLTQKSEIKQVLNFLDQAKVNSRPTSQSRIERASDYQIILHNDTNSIRVCFDVFLADVWMDDGVKPSLPYFMKDPEQVRAFFEKTIGKEIPQVTPTEPERGVSFDAVILKITPGQILVKPMEGSRELKSAGEIWVRTTDLPEETVASLGIGHGVCIVYDGMIAETYPAQIHTVYDIRPSLVEIELESKLDGFVMETTVIQYDSDDLKTEPTVTAGYSHGYANMNLQIPESWEWEVIEYRDMNTPFGIQFRPGGYSGWVRLQYWPDGFCPSDSGLTCVEGLFGYSRNRFRTGMYNGEKYWTFLYFEDLAGDYAVTWDGDWFPEYEAEILDILNSALLAEGITDEVTAKLTALQYAKQQEWIDFLYGGEQDFSVDATFLCATGIWNVTITKKDSGETCLICVDSYGNVVR